MIRDCSSRGRSGRFSARSVTTCETFSSASALRWSKLGVRPQVVEAPALLAAHGPQDLLELPVLVGAEQIPQDGGPVLAAGVQELDELALCQHDDLAPLLGVHAEDLPDLPVHLPDVPGHDLAVGVQLRRGLAALWRAVAPGPGVGRFAHHPVLRAQVLEGELHPGSGGREVALEGVGLPAAAAGLPEQGVGHGVEDHGLPGPGVAGYQEQPGPHAGEVHGGGGRVRPEGLHAQQDRLHSPHPPVSMHSLRISRW